MVLIGRGSMGEGLTLVSDCWGEAGGPGGLRKSGNMDVEIWCDGPQTVHSQA